MTEMSIRRVVPNITSSRLDESHKFYVDCLGFHVAMEMALDTGRIVTFVSPDNPTAQISLLEGAASTPHQSLTLTIEVADIDAIHDRAVTSGVEIDYPMTTESWGVRRFHVRDPNGVVINVMTHNT